MPKEDRIQLHWPTGGVMKRLALQYHPPYYAPAALNVRNDDLLAGRERGGSRPGLEKAFSTQLGSANKVRLVGEVVYVNSGTRIHLALASSNGVLYKENAGAWDAVTSDVTLASDKMLGGVDFFQKYIIAGDNHANRRLCVYNPSDNSLAVITAAAGTVPTKCTLVTSIWDRIFVAGDIDNPHLWYASRQGTYDDWEYGITGDVAAAVSATSAPFESRLSDPITALIRHTNQCLIFGCTNSVAILRGDPLNGGRMAKLSEDVGPIGPSAWCRTPDGFVFMLTKDGIYVMPYGCDAHLQSVSRERLPEELLGIDASTHEVCMAYDLRFRGIHLFVSPHTSGTSQHYFIDIKTTKGGEGGGSAEAAFWPHTYQAAHEPFSIFARQYWNPSSTNDSPVLLGCRDGYVRREDASLAQDDGSAITSYCDFLFPMAAPGHEGILAELDLVPALNSGDIDVALYTGKTAEEANAASSFSTHEFNTAGFGPKMRPRMRGAWARVRISNGESNARWALEVAEVLRRYAGQRRYSDAGT